MFKKFILGLGLLGVVSSVNASYIEIPAHYLKSGGISVHKPLERVSFKNFYFKNFNDFNNYSSGPSDLADTYSLFSLQNGVFVSRTYIANINLEKTYKTDNSFYKNNQTIPIHVGCSNSNYTYYLDFESGHVLQNCTKVYPIVKSGEIDDAGNIITTSAYDDTSLKNENNILKAKVQALEAKVYSCVQ